jgi:hypothetical protein
MYRVASVPVVALQPDDRRVGGRRERREPAPLDRAGHHADLTAFHPVDRLVVDAVEVRRISLARRHGVRVEIVGRFVDLLPGATSVGGSLDRLSADRDQRVRRFQCGDEVMNYL